MTTVVVGRDGGCVVAEVAEERFEVADRKHKSEDEVDIKVGLLSDVIPLGQLDWAEFMFFRYYIIRCNFLLDNLIQLSTHHIKLISGVRRQVDLLKTDLDYFNAFLKYASKKKLEEDKDIAFVRQIRDAVYDAEDVVDAFVTQANASRSSKWFQRFFRDPIKLDDIAQKVQNVRDDVKEVYGEKNKLDTLLREIADVGTEKPEAPRVRRENVVGLEDEAKKIIGYLTTKTEHLDVISIIGMPGLGKTTFAGKVFHEPSIQYEFPTRIWVYVSKFTPKDVFLSILKQLTSITEEMRNMTEDELAKKVSDLLERGKFLIVMDDVWTTDDWDKVAIALPKSTNVGKVLITSRYENVARHVNRVREPHELRFLNADESWELLQYEVFGEPKCPSDLEPWGKLIAHNCDGLPLSIVVIGGSLVKNYSTMADTGPRANAWREVSERVNEYLNDDPDRRIEKIISLSYDVLPYHLRACFLYFAIFPEDKSIPVWKLIRMWIAEGFIQEKTGFRLEETAENYLDDLINRNLVRADERCLDGKVKKCRIHDSLRDFCKGKAGKDKENFLQEIRKSADGKLEPSMDNDETCRRISIHTSILNFLELKPSGMRVRSFVCFYEDDIILPTESISIIPGGFKLLRVFDAKPMIFPKVPVDMYDLLHLRYIHLSFKLSTLPKAFSKLWNMQTLVVSTPERTLTFIADIWKMRNLRHLKTSAFATLPEPENDAKETGSIQTLGKISPQNCTEKILDKVRNIKRLTIGGHLSELIDGKQGSRVSFDYLRKLGALEKLKLIHNVYPSPASEGQVPYLPSPEKFPPNLRIITLSNTLLKWSQMNVLGSLDRLEVLKLKEKAFMGNYWETADGGFRHLEVLFIERTDLVVWIASSNHFPALKRLKLQNCEGLREVPIGFAEIPSLKVLELDRCQTANVSATRIKEIRSSTVEFTLSIFPPIK